MWQSRTKTDLIIEVWEKLDCENIGASEITAIEDVVRGKYGKSAVESPMIIARLLADEGAELRHAEIMELDVARRMESPYDAMFRNVIRTADFRQSLASIRRLENLRRKFRETNDSEGLRLVRETALKGKDQAAIISKDDKIDPKQRRVKAEIAEWITLWLQSPDIFENWVELRQKSAGFRKNFK